MSEQHTYKGYAFTDETSNTEDGSTALASESLDWTAGRRSQRFIDLEIFVKDADARQRAVAAARSWIDAEDGQDKLALPASFARSADRRRRSDAQHRLTRE